MALHKAQAPRSNQRGPRTRGSVGPGGHARVSCSSIMVSVCWSKTREHAFIATSCLQGRQVNTLSSKEPIDCTSQGVILMLVLKVTMVGGRTPEQKEKLIAQLSQAAASRLGWPLEEACIKRPGRISRSKYTMPGMLLSIPITAWGMRRPRQRPGRLPSIS